MLFMHPNHRSSITCTYHKMCLAAAAKKWMPRSQPIGVSCCNIRSRYVCRRQYYRRELSIPSRILSMVWCLVDTNAWRGGVVLLEWFRASRGSTARISRDGAAVVFVLQNDALESMPMRTHKTDYLRTRYWVQMPAFITIWTLNASL